MVSISRLSKHILVVCLVILAALMSGCERMFLADLPPEGQQEQTDEWISSEPIRLPLVEAPVTATPMSAERSIYLVASSFSNQPLVSNIYLIDLDQARVVWSITTRYMPEAALSPDGKRLFVADSYWTQVTRGEQRDVLSVYDAHSGEVLVDDIPIQGRVIYKGMPSAWNPYLFFSLDGEQLFLAKYGDPDISQLRLVVFDAHTLAFQDEGDWPTCNPPPAALYARQACEALQARDPRQQLSGENIPVPDSWRLSRDILLSADGKQLYVGYDTRFPDRDVFTDVIVVYDAATLKRQATLTLPGPVAQFTLSAAGDQLYAVSPFTRTLAIYRADSLQELAVMKNLGEFPSLILVPGQGKK